MTNVSVSWGHEQPKLMVSVLEAGTRNRGVGGIITLTLRCSLNGFLRLPLGALSFQSPSMRWSFSRVEEGDQETELRAGVPSAARPAPALA